MNLNESEFELLKGSHILRTNHMNYSRNVLNDGWHCAREAEPKEYNISRGGVRNLHWSTYKRMANLTDGSLPKTTYQDHFNQILLRPYYSELARDKPMVNVETLKHTHIDRDTGDPKEGFGAVLPRHFPDYIKHSLHMQQNPGFDPFEPEPAVPRDFDDQSPAYRKCHSQFTDKDDYRRPGWNTFHDESGIYANTHFKRQVYLPRNPIPKHLLDSQDQPPYANTRLVKRKLFEPRRPIPQDTAPAAQEQYDASKPFNRVDVVPRGPIPQVPASVDGKLVSPDSGPASQQEVATDGNPSSQDPQDQALIGRRHPTFFHFIEP